MRDYVNGPPSAQQVVDLFAGEWSSALPLPGVRSGEVELFDDGRIPWLVDAVGGIQGQRVLELGPLEGGHTAMLLDAGADEVVAVEANVRAYLRCLLVRELVPLDGARFLLGDAGAYVRAAADAWTGDAPAYDLVVASGVLYHLVDPVGLLEGLATLSDVIFVWTHVVDPELLDRHDPSGLRQRLGAPTTRELPDGSQVTYHPHGYALEAIGAQFCGGSEDTSTWMELDGLHATFAALGFADRVEAFHAPDHPNGPAVGLLARRPDPRPADRTRAPLLWEAGGDGSAGPPLPRRDELAALTEALAEEQARRAELETLLGRRDLRGALRRALYAWREA